MKKLCDINELSRRIEQENLSVDTALKTLEQIRAAKNEPVWELVLSSGVGAAAFGFLFGGSMWDCLAAFVCGVILQMFFSFLEAKQYFKGLARNYRRTACHDSLCDPAADRCVGTFGTGDRRGNHSDDPRCGIYQRNT